MFTSCLESQVCHLIPRSYVFFCDLILLLFSVLCIVLFLLMVSSLDFTPENPLGFFFLCGQEMGFYMAFVEQLE